MSNPSIEALNRAIADIEARLGQLPTRPGSVRASGEHVSITLDRDGQLIDADFPDARLPGLAALATELLDLQDRAIGALTSGRASDGIEFGEPVPGGATLLLGRDAPQLPDLPTQADLDRVAADLAARFDAVQAAQATAPTGRAASELVEVQVDASGLLRQVDFRDRARQVSPEELAADLVEVAALARANIQ